MFRIKYSREIILKVLYQLDLMSYEPDSVTEVVDNSFEMFNDVKKDEKEFIKRVVSKICEEKSDIDKDISENLIGWKIERLAPVDRNILRMAIGESKFDNRGKAIIIDDAVRIAKKYGNVESYKIINAVLDKVL